MKFVTKIPKFGKSIYGEVDGELKKMIESLDKKKICVVGENCIIYYVGPDNFMCRDLDGNTCKLNNSQLSEFFYQAWVSCQSDEDRSLLSAHLLKALFFVTQGGY